MEYCSFENYGKINRLRTVSGLVATPVRAGLRSAKSRAICSRAREAFESAGWMFVQDKKALPTSQKCPVVVPEEGPICIGTYRLVARLSGKLSKAEVFDLFRRVGVKVVHQSPTRQNLFELHVSREHHIGPIVKTISETPGCLYCVPDVLELVEQRGIPTDPQFDRQWQWHQIQATVAWTVSTGRIAASTGHAPRPVRIGLLDWGFGIKHPDLADAISRTGFFQESLSGRASFFADPAMVPTNDHGTFCAGLVGARQNNNRNGCGVAPDCELTLVSCLNNGIGSQVSLARAIEYAVAPRMEDPLSTQDGVDVVSVSIAPAVHNQLHPRLSDAIDFATNRGRGGKGVPFFYAVPNASVSASSDAICAHPAVIGVGNSNKLDKPFQCANGDGLEFLAPGRAVFSTTGRSAFASNTGTSFATPIAAGVAALVIAARPDLTWAEVRAQLRLSCDKVNVTYGSDLRHRSYGFGRLNAAKALGLSPS